MLLNIEHVSFSLIFFAISAIGFIASILAILLFLLFTALFRKKKSEFEIIKNHQLRLHKDLMLYGCSFEQKCKFNQFIKLTRRIKGLPSDRKRIDPTLIIRRSQSNPNHFYINNNFHKL